MCYDIVFCALERKNICFSPFKILDISEKMNLYISNQDPLSLKQVSLKITQKFEFYLHCIHV